MDTPSRKSTADLVAELERVPFAFDFFHAVRILEAAESERPRVGQARELKDEVVRFGQNPFLNFPPSTLESFWPGKNGNAGKLLVRFFGLFGPNGPMPFHFGEQARRRKRESDLEAPALVEFCNIFHHRLLTLYYRAWAVHQKSVDFDRASSAKPADPAPLPTDDWSGPRFGLYLSSLIGQGMETLRHRDAVSDWAKIYFSGLLAGRTRHAIGLQAILNEYFEVAAQVQPFVGQWLDLVSSDDRSTAGAPHRISYLCRIGGDPAWATLGKSAILGERVWESQLHFRVRLGPMSGAEFRRFLPSRRAFRHLGSWLLTYAGNTLSWEAQLVLRGNDVPLLRLGKGARLGWTTWLRDPPDPDEEVEKRRVDVEDVIIGSEPEEYTSWAIIPCRLKPGKVILETTGHMYYCPARGEEVVDEIVRHHRVDQTIDAATVRFLPGELTGVSGPRRARPLVLSAGWRSKTS